jgi:hypothetical protein
VNDSEEKMDALPMATATPTAAAIIDRDGAILASLLFCIMKKLPCNVLFCVRRISK